MPRTALIFGFAVAACSDSPPETLDRAPPHSTYVTSSETSPTTSTTTAPSSADLEVLSADCTILKDNALRAHCEVSLNRAAAVEWWMYEAETDRSMRFTSAVESTDHTVPITLLPAGASLTWEVHLLDAPSPKTPLWDGVLEVPRPPAAADLQIDRDTPSDAQRPWVLGNMGCESGYALVLDPEGRVVWYEPLVETFPGGVLSTRWTEQETVLAVVGQNRLVEIDLHGETRFEAVQGVDFTHPIHHDATRWNGWTYALHAELWSGPDESFVVDGLTVFDEAGELWTERSLATWIEPAGEPPLVSLYWLTTWGPTTDWFHANGMDLNAEGELVLTLRHQSTLAAFVGDPASADFGLPLWHVVGDPNALIPEGLVLESEPGSEIPVGYEGPHSPRYTDQGVLLLDNQASGRLDPRGLALRISPEDDTATLEQAWSVPETCVYQGGASPLQDGHVLIACGKYWFELNDEGDIVDQVTPSCDHGSVHYPSRVEPIAAPSFVQ